MKKRAVISMLLALLLALSPVYAAIGMAAGMCKTCGNTGVCVKCEGDGKCNICECIMCNDGVCKKCYGTGMYISPYTYSSRDCIGCYNGKCRYCNGNGRDYNCNTCLSTGKCYACGGDGSCADCQWLNPDARVLRVQLMANRSGKSMTLEEAEEYLRILENECRVCAGAGTCSSCNGRGYERCPKMCQPGDFCTACKQGYRDCSVCGGSGSCGACGGDGQK